MKKKTGIFLIIGIVLALMLTGCGKQSVETETAHTTEEDKLQIGLSFDSFVIERWLRDRDMFVSTAQSLGAEVNVQVAGGEVEEQISQIEYFIQKKIRLVINSGYLQSDFQNSIEVIRCHFKETFILKIYINNLRQRNAACLKIFNLLIHHI